MHNVAVFNPASPEAKAINDLFVAVLVICGGILATVGALVAYSLVRFRPRPDSGEPRQVFGSRPLERFCGPWCRVCYWCGFLS